jgi:hypothetical protein
MKIKLKKSIVLMIIFAFTFLISMVLIDNIYYCNNKEKIAENRRSLDYPQIRSLETLYWGSNINITKEQFIEAGFSFDTTQVENDTINIKIGRNK